jgi:hypothetical protein
MRRSGLLVRVAICGAIAGCSGRPSAPSGVPLFAEGRVSMTFTPQDQTFAMAAEAYRQLWVDEGSRIIEGMERESGLPFPDNHVNAVVFEGVSRSGSGNIPMYLRASYPPDVKKAALVHELGHRLIAQLTIRPADLDEHRVLFLFLYDLWERLRGRDFRRPGHGRKCTNGTVRLRVSVAMGPVARQGAAGFALRRDREGQSQIDRVH